MQGLILHPSTKRQFEQYLSHPPHALLFLGGPGSGKYFSAQNFIAQLLKEDIAKLEQYPYHLRIQSDGKSISIDTIREMQHFLKLKPATTKSGIVRAVIVENAGQLTVEAQNAFLKILEEPPHDTIIVLTAINTSELLPTVLSRLQILQMRRPVKNDIVRHFEKSFAMDEITRAYHISGGQIGLMDALLGNKDHPLISYIEQAKQIYSLDTFNRLKHVDEIIKNKQSVEELLYAMYIISRAAMYSAAEKNNKAAIKRWLHIQQQLFEVEQALPFNPHSKLALSNVMLNL